MNRGRWPFTLVVLFLLLFLPLLSAQPGRAEAGTWTFQTVDAPKQLDSLTERGLRLDAAGRPHVAYGGGHLYYAWHDGAAWHYEVVDPAPQTGLEPALALAADGSPRIAYVDAAAQALKYAYRDAAGWHLSLLDVELGQTAIGTSLALDLNGKAHISYYDYTVDAEYGRLKYARQNERGWSIDTIDRHLGWAARTSIAVDRAGFAHISYENYNLYQLKYAVRTAAGWQLQVLMQSGGARVGSHSSLALDGEDRPRIAYSDIPNSALSYAYWDGSWHFQIVDNHETVGLDCSLALDAQGRGRVSYSDWGYALGYAYQDEGGWHTATVDGERGRSAATSLALDGNGVAHIAYYDFSDEADHLLKYARQSAGGWQLSQIDAEDPVLGDVSLAIDLYGRAHIAYRAGTGLKYAYQDAGGWHEVLVDSEPYTGWYASLALDAAGYPHIAYWWPYISVRYAYRDAAGWHLEDIQSNEGMAGAYTSLALDADGYPHVSYFCMSEAALKYARKDAAGWHTEVVAGDSFVGKINTSLALESSGRPHIGFYDVGDRSVGYAYRDAGGWHVETVGYVGDTGNDMNMLSLALDSAGSPRMSYVYSDGPFDLKYARRDAGGWHVETVDAEGSVGTYSSLALDADDKAHIAYIRAYPDYDLKYAYQASTAWYIETIDSSGEVGRFPSLVLNDRGRPRIGYLDSTQQSLEYAVFRVVEYSVYVPLVLRQASAR